MCSRTVTQWLYLFVLMALTTVTMVARANDNGRSPFAEGWKEGVIQTRYLLNPALRAFAIQVTVIRDKAVLEGDVDTEIEKVLAEQVALSVDGVSRVDNRLLTCVQRQEVSPSIESDRVEKTPPRTDFGVRRGAGGRELKKPLGDFTGRPKIGSRLRNGCPVIR
ncbi:protein containing putative phospholipid-binding domain [Hahella chejuensis KCTC 2396]|uniref:Protein containing putative phospholipid-binding domain n=1 Tax=Hahella chejuensis (strain KCTC 2396) TaxID=349521 RepID=Q2SM32_HAHCH|nr:BON domain-containing protein [Hahella chejuensis]ABC28292.1 protein containing putative phospholipid-binding domain [Hahella chejuensis KCTC 2396]